MCSPSRWAAAHERHVDPAPCTDAVLAGRHQLLPIDHPATDLNSYTLFGVVLDDEPDEDAVTYLEQIVGYAWPANMSGVPAIGEGRVSVHQTTVVFDADIQLRHSRTRTREEATRTLAEQITTYYRDGSPMRKDTTQLVNRPDDIALPTIIDFMVG